jgi:DNA invertase Pin-like site-specific DNA recombinase
MKIAIYTRVSTGQQDNANQLDQLREFASKQENTPVLGAARLIRRRVALVHGAVFRLVRIMREVVITIMATLAQQERISVSERTKAGLQRAPKRGRVLGRRPVVIDVTKVRKLQAEGFGLRPIAKKLRVSVNTLRNALAVA